MNTNHFNRIPAMGLALIFGIALMFSSCSSSNDVASSHFLQKRKHRPGVHLSWGNKPQTKQHALVQKEVSKKERQLALAADEALMEKPSQASTDSLKVEQATVPVIVKPKKLQTQVVKALVKRPVLQKIAMQGLLTKSAKAKNWLEVDDPIESDKKNSDKSLLGKLALIAGILSVLCLLLAPFLWLFIFTPLALIPFLLSIVSGAFAVITGGYSYSKDREENGKIGLILGAITLGSYLAVLLFIVVVIILVLINFSR